MPPPILEGATGIEEVLPALLSRLGIIAWDVILAGDGSGAGWQTPCGWACVLIDRIYRGRQLFSGAVNKSSINFAEAMPYAQAITWYDNCVGKELMRQRGTLSVHVITDSSTVANWGCRATQLNEPLPRKHIFVWAAIRELHRLGYRFTWHWHERVSSGLNYAADLVAGLANRNFAATDPLLTPSSRAIHALANIQLTTANGQNITVYGVNPDE